MAKGSEITPVNFFLIEFTPNKAVKVLRNKGLIGVEKVRTEALLMSGKRKSKQEDNR